MKRKILTLLLVIASVFGIFAVANNSTKEAEAASGTVTLKLDASIWGSADAYYSIHYWGGETSTSWPGNKFNGGKAAKGAVEITANYDPTSTHCIIIRWGNSGYSTEWNRWDYFDNNTMGSQYNYFTNNGWNSCSSKYVAPEVTYNVNFYNSAGTLHKTVEVPDGGTFEPVFIEEEGYVLEGWYTDSNFSNKIEKGAAITSDLDVYPKYTEAEDYVVYASGDVLGDNVYAYMWSDAYAHYNTAWPGEPLTKDSRGNYVINVDASKGFDKIIFNNNDGSQTENLNLLSAEDKDTFKLSKSGSTYTASIEKTGILYNLQDLVASHYNNGVYTRTTDIYIDKEAISSDFGVHFHNPGTEGDNVLLERTTEFVDDYLYFVETGVGFGTSADGKLTSFTWNGSYENSDSETNAIEDKFFTLYDLMNANAEWTYANGVYTTSDATVIDIAEGFTAPGWQSPTVAYTDYTQVTVSVVDEKLCIQLWVSATNSGIVTSTPAGDHALFSQAIIG